MPHLVGREAELEAIFALVDSLPERGGSLVVQGEPGIGKTALLNAAGSRAARGEALVLSTLGVQAEADLAFSGLHQLLYPVLSGPLARGEELAQLDASPSAPYRLERLPDPQRDALCTAFGLSEGRAPDRLLVALAVLRLLSDVGEERPVVCLVDDAQWLDGASAQALAFVARRVLAESVVLLFAAREPTQELRDLPELVVEGVSDADARELLGAAVHGPLDQAVRERIIAETRGNPLALLEMPRGLSPQQLAGGFGVSGVVPVPSSVEEGFRRRLQALSDETRLLLLVASAEPTGNPALLWLAADQLGIAYEALEPAEADGLLEIAGRVRFRHPLVRSAVYRGAAFSDRRRVHAALADATDVHADPDRRAWHRAHATPRPDEQVAAELVRCVERGQARGGLAAAAAFLERAVGLTPDPELRAQRALHAARAKHEAGASDTALALLASAEAGPLDELGRARAELLHGQIAFAAMRGSAAPLLLRAARRLERLDAALARETYLEALSAAEFAGRLARPEGAREVALAARGALPAPRPPRPVDLLLEGLVARIGDGYAAAVPGLQLALAAFRSESVSRQEELRWLWLACRTAAQLWDAESWDVLSSRHLCLAREAGALSVLPLALSTRMSASTFAGRLGAASTLGEALEAATEAVGSNPPSYGALLLTAWRGREADATRLINAMRIEFASREEGIGVVATHWASAVLLNGLGRYEEGYAAAELASEHPEDVPFSSWSLVELVEAAVRTGKHERGAEVLVELSQMTSACGTDWALGVEARSRALLSDGDAADSLYREAIERLERSRVGVELARAHLLYGEWLRRDRRRVDAREQLRTAQEMLVAMGVEAFAERAELELLATGEHARRRTAETRENLTAQEAQVARLARDGLSNPEIGTRLFISPRTVEYHLHKVFTKLDITSRKQLHRALPQGAGSGVDA